MQIHRIRPVSGAFSASSDWSGGRVPVAGDDAILDAAGSALPVHGAVTGTGAGVVASGVLRFNAAFAPPAAVASPPRPQSSMALTSLAIPGSR